MGFNKEQVTELLYQAKDLADLTYQKASSMNFGDIVKDELYTSSESIQNILNSVFSNQGIITEEQRNELDEQMRLAKSRLLEAQSKMTFRNIKIYGSIGLISLIFLWYLTRENK